MNIIRKKGNIIIPHSLVMEYKYNIKKILPGVKWGGSKRKYWKLYDTDSNIKKVNNLFCVNLSLNLVIDQKPINTSLLKTKPYTHQIEALMKCGPKRKFFGYFLDMGLGKTKVTIDDVTLIGDINAVLVVCPKSVLHVWEEELLIHSNINSDQITVWPNEPGSLNHDKIQWFIINYDAFYHKGFNIAEKFLLNNNISMIVLDESTVIKNFKTQINEALMKLKVLSNYRRILTGTPMDNPLDIYGQFNFLDESCVNYRNYYAFRNHFCVMGGYKNKQVIYFTNKSELSNLIKKHTIRKKLEEAIELPEKTYQIRYITLNQEAMDIYNELEEELVVELENNKITVKEAIVSLTKLQQITGGIVKGEKGNILTGTEKIDEIKSVLNTNKRLPCLIWVQYRNEISILKKELSKSYKVLTMHGGTKNRSIITNQFNNNKADILILQNKVGSFGLTLNTATLSIYYSNSLSSIIRDQSERRNYRIGQVNNVLYLDIVCKNLMDHAILKLIKRKKSIMDSLLSTEQVKEFICQK